VSVLVDVKVTLPPPASAAPVIEKIVGTAGVVEPPPPLADVTVTSAGLEVLPPPQP
jgi:hypothetical protein